LSQHHTVQKLCAALTTARSTLQLIADMPRNTRAGRLARGVVLFLETQLEGKSK